MVTRNVFHTGDRSNSIRRGTIEDSMQNNIKEKSKLIETEKVETGSVSMPLRVLVSLFRYIFLK